MFAIYKLYTACNVHSWLESQTKLNFPMDFIRGECDHFIVILNLSIVFPI